VGVGAVGAVGVRVVIGVGVIIGVGVTGVTMSIITCHSTVAGRAAPTGFTITTV
jgi:hypothetical protein